MVSADVEPAPSATVYVKNLEERIKLPDLIEGLREIFVEYGTIVDIVARKNLRAKGQAFVVFDEIESAQNAIDEINGFELFGKQMHCEFAKTRSDKTVETEGTPEELEQHKRHRLAEKERKQALRAAEEKAQAKANKRAAPTEEPDGVQRTAKVARAAGVVPDEYLPPNKILFVRQLPDEYGADSLTTIFSRFGGFKEVRMVPGRKGIAFVEYESEEGAISAKEATAGMTLADQAIRVTFQRG